MNKFFFPREKTEKAPFMNIDGDAALILLLVLIIIREKGDNMLIMALLYVLS